MNRIITMLLLGVVLLFAVSACNDSSTTPEESGSYSGILVDQSDAFVVDAQVTAYSGSTIFSKDTTNEDGEFTLSNLPESLDAVMLKFEHPELKTFSESFTKHFTPNDHSGKKKVILGENDSCCGTIVVYVNDATTQAPVPNAEVRLNKHDHKIKMKRTDSNGKIIFEHVCPGDYWIRVANSSYNVVEQNVGVADCDTVRKYIVLSPKENNSDTCCHGTLTFQVLDSTSGQPLPGANVKLRKNGQIEHTLIADANGFVHFTQICPGRYSVLYWKDGYNTAEYNFEAKCNDTIAVSKKLYAKCCNSFVKVKLFDKSNNLPLINATVKLWQNGAIVATQLTPNGEAIFTNVCEGKYAIDVIKDGFKGIEWALTVACSDTLVYEKLIESKNSDTCCKGKVYVIVKDSTSGSPLAGATVKLWLGGSIKSTATTNPNGLAVFEGICPNAYGVSILKDGYKGSEFQFTANCNSQLEFHKSILANNDTCCTAKLTLLVKDLTTALAISGAEVKIYKNGVKINTKKTNADGAVVFEQLCSPGEYSVSFSAANHKTKEVSFKFTVCKAVQETIRLEQE